MNVRLFAHHQLLELLSALRDFDYLDVMFEEMDYHAAYFETEFQEIKVCRNEAGEPIAYEKDKGDDVWSVIEGIEFCL